MEREISGRLTFADDEDWYSVNVLGEGVLTLNLIATGEQSSEGMEINCLPGGQRQLEQSEFIKSLSWWGNYSTTIPLGEAGPTILKYILTPKLILTRLINLLLILSWDYPE